MHIAHGLGYRFFGYAILPNHFHFVIRVPEGGAVNTVLANGKRFLAYDIIERSKALGLDDVLRNSSREFASDSARKQKHRDFATTTDLTELFDARMIEQS
ncbi:MAG: hypothetical protein IPF64_12755 [Flavobacteriales bacterium]|nr:hypothetical protein [Flavobacteriales bacterium]